MPEFNVPLSNASTTLKEFLRYDVGFSLTTWRKLKHKGILKVNGQAALANTLISPGDTITVEWPQTSTILPADLPLTIKYEDDYLLVVDKPANMLVHPAKYADTDTLANAIAHYYRKNNLSLDYHPVHRLDRNTSGLVLIAKLPYIQHLLSDNNVKNIQRIYWGIAEGTLTPPAGTINAPIGRHPDSIIERIVRSDGQPAVTTYRTIKSMRDASLVELELMTGRTHQIRVHLSSIGHPLLGDDLYGGSTDIISRQALHAVHLAFVHPVTNNNIEVICPPPADFEQAVYALSH